MSYDLKNKKDAVLIADLKDLLSQERQLLTQILHYLLEVEKRKLYLGMGYSSLFDLLTTGLHYSEAAAYRRIQAMRLLRDVPEVETKIKAGKLSLSVISQVQGFIQKEDQKRKASCEPRLKKEEKLELVRQLEGSSARSCERKLAKISPETTLPPEKTQVLNMEKIRIQFNVDRDVMDKIDQLMSLLSHQNPKGSYEQLFTQLVDMGLEKLDPERREEKRKKRCEKRRQKSTLKESVLLPTSESNLKSKSASRKIPSALRDKLWLRDQGECQYRNPSTGKICGSKHRLQHDHRYPYSLGGEHSEQNLRLRCRSHNVYQAQEILDLPPLNHPIE